MKVEDVIRMSAQWLLDNQDPNSGGWASQPGSSANSLNTAEAIIALIASGVAAGDAKIAHAVRYLESSQITEGTDAGAWPREVREADGIRQVADITRTSVAIQALVRSGKGVEDDAFARGVGWLIDVGNDEGGWGFRRASTTALTPTCFALISLAEAHRAGMEKCQEPVTEGLALLVRKFHNRAGSFGKSESRLEAVQTIYSVLALQAARDARLSRYGSEERRAIEWLRSHPSDATKLVEEEIALEDPDLGANYGFLVMTDALLVRTLQGSDHKEHSEGSLARDAMVALGDRIDIDRGGFYGSRVFSWSTARALYAMSIAASRYDEIPDRRREYPGPKAGNFIFLFAILLSSLVVFLSVVDRFELLHAAIFMFLMLSSLLAFGTIREKTFKELVAPIGGIFKGG